MTLKEKIGQMNQYNGFWEATGPTPTGGSAKEKYDALKAGLIGSVLNVTGVENVRKLQEVAVNETRLGIPLIFAMDVIHGHKTLSPIPIAEAASWDMEAIEASSRMAAIEAAATGINWTFAPMIDVSREPRWGRVMEGGGEDVYLGSHIGVARVKGFQGDDLSRHDTVAACAKHFAAYGFAEAGKEYNTADIGRITLFNEVLPPFKALVDAGVATVMNSFNVLNGIPATADRYLQRDILKGAWNFEGVIVSDWGSIGELISHNFAEDLRHAGHLAITAGCDIDMEAGAYVNHLEDLITEGIISIDLINDSVRRILNLKFQLGLFDDPYRYCDINREKEQLYHQDHKATALMMAQKSIVLLKNENNLLPLSTDHQKIGVIGTLASDKNSPLGGWRVGSEDNTAISILEGLDALHVEYEYASGVRLINAPTTFVNEVKINENDPSGIDEAVALAKTTDIVVMVVGEHGYQSGEGRSRTNLNLPGLQQQMLESVYKVNPNIILVVMSGRPLVLTWAEEHLPSIVQAWQLGSESGHAIASVLYGLFNPSAKLPMTFPRSLGQVPIHYNHLNTGRSEEIKDIVFWTHYIDELNAPLYPFGYGLSYSSFEYQDMRIDSEDPESIKVEISITNNSDRAGEEIVQLYIRDIVASVVRPVKELKGFKKVHLKPQEKKVIKFELSEAHLGFYNNEGDYIVEAGKFDVTVGPNSRDGITQHFLLKR